MNSDKLYDAIKVEINKVPLKVVAKYLRKLGYKGATVDYLKVRGGAAIWMFSDLIMKGKLTLEQVKENLKN